MGLFTFFVCAFSRSDWDTSKGPVQLDPAGGELDLVAEFHGTYTPDGVAPEYYIVYLRAFWYYIMYSVFKGVLVIFSVLKGVLKTFSVFIAEFWIGS